MAVKHRLYLRVGDPVAHRDHEEWGNGTVVEQMTSVLEGGTCLVRVNFADGQSEPLIITLTASPAVISSGCVVNDAQGPRQ